MRLLSIMLLPFDVICCCNRFQIKPQVLNDFQPEIKMIITFVYGTVHQVNLNTFCSEYRRYGRNTNLSREVSIKSIFSLHSISLGLSVLEWMELPITLMISMLSEMRIHIGAKATMMLQPILSSVLIEHLPHFPSRCVIRSSSFPSALALSQT